MSVLKSPAEYGAPVPVEAVTRGRDRWLWQVPTLGWFAFALVAGVTAAGLATFGAHPLLTGVVSKAGLVILYAAVLVACVRTLTGVVTLVKVLRGDGDVSL